MSSFFIPTHKIRQEATLIVRLVFFFCYFALIVKYNGPRFWNTLNEHVTEELKYIFQL